jgi:hypothetical protein
VQGFGSQALDPTVPHGGAPLAGTQQSPAVASGMAPADQAPGQAMVPVVGAAGSPMMVPVPPPAPGVHGPKGMVRSGITSLILCVVTFGVYQIIWFIKTCNEMANFLQRDEPSWIRIMALSIVTCGFYGLYWTIAKCGALIQECQLRAGVPNPQNHGFIYIVPYYNVILMTEELNKAWQGPA